MHDVLVAKWANKAEELSAENENGPDQREAERH